MIGHDDAINDPVEGGPPVSGASEADGAARAVRDDVSDKCVLVCHALELIDGDDVSVDVYGTGPVVPAEGKTLERSVSRQELVRGIAPELGVEFPGDETPREEKCDSDDVGGHGRSFLLIQLECCPRATRVRGISDTHETRSRPLSKIILFASQDLISCLPACQSALSDKDLLDLSMKADIYITYGRACQ